MFEVLEALRLFCVCVAIACGCTAFSFLTLDYLVAEDWL